jgi:hypothetical protein
MESSRQTRSASARRKEKEKENLEDDQEINKKNNQLLNLLKEYEEDDLQDEYMWGVFLKDFKDWEMSDFSNCPSGKLERLRQLL